MTEYRRSPPLRPNPSPLEAALTPLTAVIEAGIHAALPEGRRRGALVDVWARVAGGPVFGRASWDIPADGGLPVVLVHGLAVSGLYMTPTALRLAPYRRVYMPDLPGFGRSWKPRPALGIAALAGALSEWMGALGIGRAVVVGNSMGCQIAADLALRHPDRVAGLVFVGPTMDPRDRTMRGEGWRLLRAMVREPPLLGAIEVRDGLLFGLRRLYTTARLALNDPIQARLPRLRQPALVVRGEHDPIVPPEWAQRAADLLPDGQLVTVRGATHAVNLDAPDQLTRIVREFVSRLG